MLKKDFIRDGNRRIIASVTKGYGGGTSDVVRDEHGKIVGRTSDLFQTTRDGSDKLVSSKKSLRVF